MASKELGDLENIILKVPACQVLHNFDILKQICLILNREDTLTNWKDVAGSLGFTNDEIFGFFVRQPSPAEAVLSEWMIRRKGELGTLIVIFQQNKMYSCLDELQGAIEEYKKQLYKKPAQENESCEDEEDTQDKEGENTFLQEKDSNNCIEPNTVRNSVLPTRNKTKQRMGDDKKVSKQDEKLSKVQSIQSPNSCHSNINSDGTKNCCDSVSKIPELIQWKDYESKFKSGNMNSQNELSTPEKSINLLKRFFRTLSSDPNIGSKTSFNHKAATSYRRSNSDTLPNTIRLTEKTPKKKSGSFRMLQSKIFKGKKPSQERCYDSPSDVQSTRSNETTGMACVTPQTSSRESNTSKSCPNSSDQAHKSEDCLGQTSQSSTNKELQNGMQQQNKTGEDIQQPDANCLLRPASSSSEESIQSPTVVDSGFSSAEESKRVFIVHGKDKYSEAKELYLSFQKNSHYDCHMEAVNSLEVAEDKPLYVMKEIMVGDFVLICVSSLLKEIFEEGIKETVDDLGLTFAGSLIRGNIYSSGKNPRGKFMTVLTAGSSRDDIPFFMLPYESYKWPGDKKKMQNIIEGKPEFVPPPIATVRNEPKPRKITPPSFS